MERNGWQWWHRASAFGHGMVVRGPRARPACTRALPCPSLSPPLHSTVPICHVAMLHSACSWYPSVRVTVQYVCVGVVVWQ